MVQNCSENNPKTSFGAALGRLRGGSWGLLEPLGASWGPPGLLGGVLGRPGASGGRLGASWGRLEGVLERL